jgi:hypothetical protein
MGPRFDMGGICEERHEGLGDIVKDLVIDMAAWKLAMHVPKH